MSSKNDRRSGVDRRASSDDAASQPVESRERERRESDRRDSPRLPIELWVRHLDLGGSYEQRAGDIGVGGVSFEERFAPAGRRVALRFRIPGLEREVRCEGEILRITESGGAFGVHVRFLELEAATELAIARFIDQKAFGKQA